MKYNKKIIGIYNSEIGANIYKNDCIKRDIPAIVIKEIDNSGYVWYNVYEIY